VPLRSRPASNQWQREVSEVPTIESINDLKKADELFGPKAAAQKAEALAARPAFERGTQPLTEPYLTKTWVATRDGHKMRPVKTYPASLLTVLWREGYTTICSVPGDERELRLGGPWTWHDLREDEALVERPVYDRDTPDNPQISGIGWLTGRYVEPGTAERMRAKREKFGTDRRDAPT
jgi:hypothetical protein